MSVPTLLAAVINNFGSSWAEECSRTWLVVRGGERVRRRGGRRRGAEEVLRRLGARLGAERGQVAVGAAAVDDGRGVLAGLLGRVRLLERHLSPGRIACTHTCQKNACRAVAATTSARETKEKKMEKN